MQKQPFPSLATAASASAELNNSFELCRSPFPLFVLCVLVFMKSQGKIGLLNQMPHVRIKSGESGQNFEGAKRRKSGVENEREN